VFENRVLRRKREEVAGGWRRLHKEFRNFYTSPNITGVIKSRRMRWAGHEAHTDEMRNEYRILVRKPEGKRSVIRPNSRWEDNIRMDLREIGWECVDRCIWLRIGTSGGLL
jgi:hypothetical protein